MEGKFIEGFDKRYKIFEDGVVVSYVSKNPKILKLSKEGRYFLTKKGETKKGNIKISKLMDTYFPKKNDDDWNWIKIEKNGIMYDYEEKYRIYKNGEVESLVGNKKILKPYINNKGYLVIRLSKKDEKGENLIKFRVHRLIATAFIPNPDNKEQIDHLDGNRTNNSISNLKWKTHKENMLNKKNWGKYKKGVNFNKKANKFQSAIYIDGKQIYLGLYETEEEAHEVFKQKFIEIHGIEPCSR